MKGIVIEQKTLFAAALISTNLLARDVKMVQSFVSHVSTLQKMDKYVEDHDRYCFGAQFMLGALSFVPEQLLAGYFDLEALKPITENMLRAVVETHVPSVIFDIYKLENEKTILTLSNICRWLYESRTYS